VSLCSNVKKILLLFNKIIANNNGINLILFTIVYNYNNENNNHFITLILIFMSFYICAVFSFFLML